MHTYWLVPVLTAAGLQWYARWRDHRRLHLVTKPAVLALLILWISLATRLQGFTFWAALALIFSLLGDIFLMLPPSFFMPGLAAFLTGHICYIVGFGILQARMSPLLWIIGTVILALTLYTLRYYWAALRERLFSKKIRSAVMAYIIVIFVMIFSASSTLWQAAWAPVNAALVIGGAVLFAVSDSTLAYNRFIRKIPHAHVWIMITYHLAQILITYGVICQAVYG